MRLFIAVSVPPVVRSLLEERMRGPYSLPFVEPDKLHITVRFLGDVHAEYVDELIEKLDCVEADSFNLWIDGLGTFPEDRRLPPYVIWARLGDTKGIVQLKGRIDGRLGKDPLCAKRPYSPHLTLAKPRPEHHTEVSRFLSEHPKLVTANWTVGEFTLYSSPGGGGRFTPVRTFYLKGQRSLF
jgi:RNA 2',3'-cyclic 3'-phosphodiesterase